MVEVPNATLLLYKNLCFDCYGKEVGSKSSNPGTNQKVVRSILILSLFAYAKLNQSSLAVKARFSSAIAAMNDVCAMPYISNSLYGEATDTLTWPTIILSLYRAQASSSGDMDHT